MNAQLTVILRTTLLCLSLSMAAPVLASCPQGVIFSGGLSNNSGADFVSEAGAAESIFIGGSLCPQSEHVGMTADILVAVEVGSELLVVDSNGQLQAFNPEQIPAFRSAIVLDSSNAVEVFQGVAGQAYSAVNLYVAYRLGESVYLDGSPSSFSIDAEPTLHALRVNPLPGSTSIDGDTMSIEFDRPLDPDSIQNSDLKMFGRWTGVIDASLTLSPSQQSIDVSVAQSLSAGEAIALSLPAGSVQAADGSQFGKGLSWTHWIKTGFADLNFTEIAQVSAREAGSQEQIQTYGAYAGDLNEDGWSDFVVPNEISNDLRIFLNDGAGNYDDFTIVPIDGADRPSPNEGADLDGDGDIDFVVGSAAGNMVHVFHGDGAGMLTQTQNLVAGERVRGVCLLDFENDGDQDVLATTYAGNRVALFTNDGTGTFSSAFTFDVANGEWSCAAADMNGDGLTDAVIGTRISDELVTLISNGDGTFTQAFSVAAAGDPWMLAAGDMDRDGNADIVAVNAQEQTLTVALGNGAGALSPPVSYSTAENNAGFPLAVDLGDLDGDGDLDVVTSDFSTRLFLIFENLGNGTLVRQANQLFAPEAASCAILHDRDNDGDLDITGIDEVADLLLLYRN
jgi:hypothetical protein